MIFSKKVMGGKVKLEADNFLKLAYIKVYLVTSFNA
jgi:hypothetical protein